jgi:mRNA interferase RelE/StbE
MSVDFSPAAQSDLQGLDAQYQERVIEAIERFATTGHGDVQKLRGRKGEYRLRVGDWRVIFTRPQPSLVRVLRGRPRASAYR